MEPTHESDPITGRDAAFPFLAVGVSAIILGGLFSAATARLASYHSAWFVAYLVLVVGVAQVGLGLGQGRLATKPLTVAVLFAELLLFNIGNAGVVLGSLTAEPLWVNIGSAILLVSLTIFAWMVWPARRRGALLWGFWALLLLLFVSVFVGLFFANF
ncbi:MAG: hypothetical protein ABIW32_09790 [Terrimesophilobacter sp.]